MADRTPKAASILLRKEGKTRSIFLFNFERFSGQSEDAGTFRAKIDGCWHCPDGKYTAIGPHAVMETNPRRSPARRAGVE